MSNVNIHPSAVIDPTAVVADDVVVGPNCVVGAQTTIGSGTLLDANVVIGDRVKIGSNNHFFSNCVIGRSPQLLGLKPGQEVGLLEIGDNNTIRENVTIHPSMHPGEYTRVGNSNLIMIGVHIGHDCILDDNIVISNYTQVSGHCHLQTGVWLSGMVAIHQFVTVGKWAYAAGFTGINHDIPPYVIVSGHYPPTIRAINKRGLGRAGLTDKQIREVFAAFKKLYRDSGVILEKAKAIAADPQCDPAVKDMADCIIKSHEHRFGRYLENFRH